MNQSDVARATGLSRQRVNQLTQSGLSLQQIRARGRIEQFGPWQQREPATRRAFPRATHHDYLTTTRYIGRPGVVELRASAAGRRVLWSWRFMGCSVFWNRATSKLDALIDAANACGLSGQRAGWFPEKKR